MELRSRAAHSRCMVGRVSSTPLSPVKLHVLELLVFLYGMPLKKEFVYGNTAI